jgi:hypothetical protein
MELVQLCWSGRKFCQHWTYSRRVLNEAHYGVGGTDRLGRGLDVDER